MHEAVAKLWPEIQWIEDKTLRSQVTETWVKALARSPLQPDDLNRIPFTLLVPNCPITFMEHKRCVVHIAAPARKPCRNSWAGPCRSTSTLLLQGRFSPMWASCWNTNWVRMAGAGRANGAKCCGIRLPESRWRWSAACPTQCATSSRPTRRKAIW